MSYSQWLMNDVTSAMGWALVHSVWQGVAAAMVLAGTMWVMRHRAPGGRYLAGCTCLAAVVIAFAATLWINLPNERAVRVGGVLPAAMPLRSIAVDVPEQAFTPTVPEWTLERAMPWVVAAWLMGVVVLSAWQFGGWLLLGRYLRMAEPADDAWAARLARVAERIGVRRVAMVITRRLDVPVVVGAFRPYILMPAAVLSNLSIAQVEAILAHELAHVRRYDYLVNLIQSAIETLLFYHPAVWWISRQIRREREYCCDELAAKACGDRAIYARALAALEQSRVVRLAPAAAGNGRGELLERVKRLLNTPTPSPRRTGRSRSWVAAAMVLGGCIAIGFWSRQLVAQPAPAPATPTTVPSVAPTTRRAGPPAVNSAIVPEDFVAGRGDYQIGANDLIQVSISDLVGPGVETVKAMRVSESGFIALPLIGQVKAADLSEGQLMQEITMAYKNAAIIQNAMVFVTVMEARNRTFSVYGSVRQPGQYQLLNNDFRLFDALTLARGTTANTDIRLIRPTKDPESPRVIEIPAAAVAAADPKINIVIQPKDFIFVTQPPRGASSGMTPAEEAQLQEVLRRGVVSAQGAWDSIQKRINAGEALTPSVVQLQLDTARRVFEAKVAATSDPAQRVAAAEECLKRCLELAEMLNKRLGQDVTQVQISQAEASVQAIQAALIRLKAEARQASPQRSVRILVNESQLLVDGKPTDWAGIRKQIQDIPESDRAGVMLEIAAGSKATPVSRFFNAERDARLLSEQFGLAGVQIAGVDPNATEKLTGEYYIGGHVPRTGVYSLSGREITLRQAIIAAGGPDTEASVVEIARKVDGRAQVLVRNVSIAEIMSGNAPEVVLQPDDEIMIGSRPAPGSVRGR